MALSGSFNTSGYNGRYLTFSWSISSQSIENNTTTISWTLKGAGTSTESGVKMYKSGAFKVVIDGETVYSKSQDYRIQLYSGTVVASGTKTISHNSDGTRSFSASAQAGIYYFAVNCSGSGSWTLDTIPRASSITSASNITLGNACNIKWTPANSSFQYKIKFALGGWSYTTGYISPSTTSAYSYTGYTISGTTVANGTTIYAQLPSSTSGTMTATLYTYNSGGTQIGSSSSKQFTVTIPSNVQPTVGTITLDPVNITTKDGSSRNILITGKNQLTISVSGFAAGAGSSIQSYTYSGTNISSSTTSTSVTSSSNINPSISGASTTLTYTVKVTDNRGRHASGTKTITCYNYSTPTFSSFEAYRCTANGTADTSGTYVKCSYTVKYSYVNNTNNIYSFVISGVTSSNITYNSWSTSTSSGIVTATGSALIKNCSLASTYNLTATFVDNYSSSASSNKVTIFSAERILNIRSGGTGIAFGKIADKNNVLDSKWPIRTDAPEQTMANLTYKGTNLLSTTDDTEANWADMGNLATVYYNQTGKLNGQPSQYGYLLNLTVGPGSTQVHHIWAEQANGSLFHRGGNANGMYDWKEIFDTSNCPGVMPTTLYTNSSGITGTITLTYSAANYNYLEIFYADNNSRQPSSVRIYAPNGKYVTLSCIEPSTNGSEPRIYIRTSGWTISGTTMTPGRTDLDGLNRGVYGQLYPYAGGANTNIDVNITANNYIKIFRVIGYK